jgi:hypothetical protein
LGDYIDRGPSRETIDRLIEQQDAWIVFLKGNHELIASNAW